MSASRRPRRLRIDTFEDRVVPTLGVGINVDSFGLTGAAPDGNSLAAGPNNVVQFLAGDVEVFDKAGNFLRSEADTDFWTAAGISSSLFSVGLSEPRVVYDSLSQRWFATEISLAVNNNEIFVARSDTSDPTGHWSAVHYTGAAGLLTGFPTLGVDANGVYVGAANLDNPFPGFIAPTASGVSLTAIPKADLLAAAPTAANRTTFTQPDSSVTMGWAPQVVTDFDPNPARATIVATGYYQTEFNQIVVTPITWSGGVPTLGTSQHIATNLQTSLPGNSRQPNGTRIISGGEDDRYAGAIYQVGDLIYAAHPISVNSSGTPVTSGTSSHNAIHLVVLRASTDTIEAEKIYFNNSYDYSFASVAANASGDIVMGLNRSGTSTTNGQLGGYVVHGHLDLTNPNVLQRITFDQELAVAPGQTNGFNLGDNPEGWGPYSATVVDPTNPNVFWTTQEYATASDTWISRVSQVAVLVNAVNASTTATNGTYGVGAVIPITIAFSGPVTVTGTPKLNLNSGGVATYTGGSGTSTLTFTYTVAAGNSSPDLDYVSTTPFDLTGASIDGDGGVPAVLTLPAPGTAGSLSASFDLVVDTSGSRVAGVSSPLADGTYGAGAVVPVTVTFNHPVAVTGTPQLALNSSGTATYTGGSGTGTLTFTYTVAAGQSAADLDEASATALTLNGGSITDLTLGGPAGLTLPAPGAAGSLGANKNIAIDAVTATVAGVSSPTADGTYGVGAVITVTVQFTKAVTVTGTPLLALNSGGTASYVSGSGTNTLTFTYTVAAGQSAADLDYASATALTLNGGSIQAGGLGATLTLPAPGAAGSLGTNKNIAVDTAGTTVANVTSPTPDGAYNIGAVIDVTVRFTNPVTVTGTPQLALNSGGSAGYLGGSGTDTLTFRYTVGAGDSAADLDYASATALTLNGGSIQAGGQPAVLTLPAPGSAGSLGANKDIAVDAIGPAIVDYRVLYGSRWYSLIGSTRTDLPWVVTGVQVVFDEPVWSGNARSLGGFTAIRMTGLKTTTLTWKFRGVGLGSFNTTLAASGANALKDRSGNPIQPFGQSFKVLWGDVNDDGVVSALDEAAVRAAQGGPYQPGSVGYNRFADLSGDGLVNLVDVGITRTRRGTHL